MDHTRQGSCNSFCYFFFLFSLFLQISFQMCWMFTPYFYLSIWSMSRNIVGTKRSWHNISHVYASQSSQSGGGKQVTFWECYLRSHESWIVPSFVWGTDSWPEPKASQGPISQSAEWTFRFWWLVKSLNSLQFAWHMQAFMLRADFLPKLS